jgi:predicted nucleic acid-binding protein
MQGADVTKWRRRIQLLYASLRELTMSIRVNDLNIAAQVRSEGLVLAKNYLGQLRQATPCQTFLP